MWPVCPDLTNPIADIFFNSDGYLDLQLKSGLTMSMSERAKPSKTLSPVSLKLQQIREALIYVEVEGKEN
jgi:hypothetical protein